MKQKRTIACYETDAKRNLKPYAFLNIVQELANQDAIHLGFGYEQLVEKGSIWVLSRIKVDYIRPPVWREEIIAETWHKGSEGIFSFRDFLIQSADEKELLIRATSSWLIIDSKTRRIQRPQAFFDPSDESIQIYRHAIEEPCDKIPIPEKGLHLAETRNVRYSDMDMNLHMNSAKYVEWAMDCVNNKRPVPQTVSSFQISFNAEARFAQSIDLYTVETVSGTQYVEGKREGKSIFQAFISR
ncbi:MAG: hypothetical protein GX877_02140 [Bacteroidales bacterium]|nr:hypothetical protein [Bacteroidales bacterium]